MTEIRNDGGWNQYHLVDMDTGETVVRARYQLEVIPFIDMGFEEDFGEMMMEADVPPEPFTSPSEVSMPVVPAVKRTWTERSEGDLVRLQENRHSKSTSNQTKWAAKMFRGESGIVVKKLAVLLQEL